MTQKLLTQVDPTHILKIRVARGAVRNLLFPFDLFYLIPGVRKDVLPRLFPWSLCLPPVDALLYLIWNLRIDVAEFLPHNGRTKTRNVKRDEITLRALPIKFKQYFVSVPILPLTTVDEVDKKRVKRLSYLVAPQHVYDENQQATNSKFADILTEDTILFTPQGPVQPVCSICPRYMLYLMHKCTLGCRLCFETLVLRRPLRNVQLQENNINTNIPS